MKVLHLNNLADGSGADLAFADTVAALREHTSIESLVATADPRHAADLALTSWKDRRGAAKLSYLYSADNRRRLTDFIEAQRPDVIHAHGFYADISPSILGAIADAKRRRPMKFVQTAHSHELVCANAPAYDYRQQRICTDCRGLQPKWKIFYRNCDRRGWAHSWVKGVRCIVAQQLMHQVTLTDHLVCPSRMMMDSLGAEGIAADRLSVIRNPVLVSRRDAAATRAPEMVYFGRFAPEKDVTMLAEAFITFHASNPAWRLLLIGEGPEQARLQSRCGALDYIDILPFMPREPLFDRIGRSRIMLMGSRLLENAPLVIPESVMCGLWPVVPAHGGMGEMVAYLGAGSTYRHGDADAMQAALQAAASMEDAPASIAAAQQRIEQEMSAAHYAHEVEALYRRLVA